MEVHQLLLPGMLVGLVMALFACGFARVFGEPSVDRAISIEGAILEKAMAGAAKPGHAVTDDDPAIFSRPTQAGLFTAIVLVGTAIGGLFSLLFALCFERYFHLSPKVFPWVLGLICFVTVYLVPNLKYPANPLSIGEPSTIGIRTGLYFSMIAISLAAFSLRRRLVDRLGSWS